jgi:branched-chain amino acid transport system ATP-binding protein
MLKVKEVETRYGNVVVLKEVSLSVKKKSIICLIGSNGAGKTTTLNTISGLIRPFKGSIEFKGQRIDLMEPHEVVKMGLIQVPEGRRLFPDMTVLENLEIGAYRHHKVPSKMIEKVFEVFGVLEERVGQVAGSLSGGEQQMLAIGRALMAEPELMMLDEPTLGLAPMVVKIVFQTVEQINEWGTTIFLVEQNAKFALEISEHAYVMESGRIVMEGGAGELINDDNVRKSYLGI